MIKNELSETTTRIQQLKDEYCDYYKDVHGIKARWVYEQDLTEAQLEQMLESLGQEAAVVFQEEAAQEAANEVEARKQIQALLDLGAKDVAMAIRWMHEANDTGGDNSFLDFDLGVRYGFTSEVLAKGL